MSDIRKWFMKQHDNGSTNAAKLAKPEAQKKLEPEKPVSELDSEEGSKRRKTSKYFAEGEPGSKQKTVEDIRADKSSSKRKPISLVEDSKDEIRPKKKILKDDDDEDFVLPTDKKKPAGITDANKSKRKAKYIEDTSDTDEENEDKTPIKAGSSSKPAGRGSGVRGSGATPGAGRGRGGGRGGFMNFGERKDPPHKGQKEIPEGASDCLAGLTFVISGTLDSLEREEAEDLIKRYGGRVTGSVSKKTNYLLADEDIGGRKSSKAKELGTSFLTEDGLFDMIHKSKPAKAPISEVSNKRNVESSVKQTSRTSPMKVERRGGQENNSAVKVAPSVAPLKISPKSLEKGVSPKAKKVGSSDVHSKTWTEKYRPKTVSDIVGNQSLVQQLRAWLADWSKHFLHTGQKGKGKKQTDGGAKKAVLLSGPPGIGKTTSAKLVCEVLGFQAVEVNASDSRGKADTKIFKGVSGSTSNSVKELVSNESLNLGADRSNLPKTVLIMDEVDGMSAGDRGGVADLIASIKIAKIPIICICNDRYSQKLKSLVNYCLPLNYRRPTKQQMAKRLLQIASAEGIQANEIAMEELAERVNGDIRLAINQLQYMSLSKSVIKYDDVKDRLQNTSKDEDISPFTAVDKLFGYDGGKLRMDERIDLSMSDPDLVPLIIQENYLNYSPVSASKDANGTKRMSLIACAAESIGDGDIINVQIRRYRQWQLSPAASLASCIIPASLLHGRREVLEQGERNFNRFGGWLGKNSTAGKNLRLLQDVHAHILASQQSYLDRDALRLDYFTVLVRNLTDPLRVMSKDVAVQKVVEFMDAYSLSQEDYDSMLELSKYQGHPSPLDGVLPAVKAALTKAYKQGSSSRVIRAADLITLPGIKKAPKKRIAAILEPVVDEVVQENGDVSLEIEENDSDAEEADDTNVEPKVQLDIQSNQSKGIQVQLDLKNSGNSDVKKSTGNRSKGSASVEKKGRGGGAAAAKRKR